MQLFFDSRDDVLFEKRGMRNLYWLDDLGAIPIQDAQNDAIGFLFAGARDIADYRKLIAPFGGGITDTAEARSPLLRLETVLEAIESAKLDTPRPRTWVLPLDCPIPNDLEYPLFVRAGISSWKLGGKISKVHNERELVAEAGELRRAFGVEENILARQWLEIVPAGESMYGPVPVEIRTWIVDQKPLAWSFHHVHSVTNPTGFPPTAGELTSICEMASEIGSAFDSRLVCADFVKLVTGEWLFLEAGPGSCAGTGHEAVYKSVAGHLVGIDVDMIFDSFGGLF